MAQTIDFTVAEYTLLANAEPLSALVIGGSTDSPNLRQVTAAQQITALDLRIRISDIQDPLPPNIADLTIRSITLNGQRYTSILQWRPVWDQLYARNNPVTAQAIAQTRTSVKGPYSRPSAVPGYIDPVSNQWRPLTEHQVTREEIIVPGSTLSLADSLPPAPQPLVITLLPVAEATPVLAPEIEDQAQPSVIAVDLGPGGELITTLSDSTQEIVGVVVEPQVPSGAIISFYGNFDNIPEGYVLCDGTENTPDLSGDFVIDPDPDLQFFYIKKQ